MKVLHIIAFILLVVGGLNWLLVGALGLDLVAKVLGDGSMLARAVYVLVGIAAVLEFVTHKKSCKACMAGGGSAPTPSV
ncbi:MAG: DUF378 domain-containing protein [bacterium]|nr:DUF378 domain-containing protein [bacterium]